MWAVAGSADRTTCCILTQIRKLVLGLLAQTELAIFEVLLMIFVLVETLGLLFSSFERD